MEVPKNPNKGIQIGGDSQKTCKLEQGCEGSQTSMQEHKKCCKFSEANKSVEGGRGCQKTYKKRKEIDGSE